ncbi:MAG: TolC family protein [Campylobacterota bacterium]|nr:TolC family protein [Campylobacterota bacterium]
MHALFLPFLLLFLGCTVPQEVPLTSTIAIPKQYVEEQNTHASVLLESIDYRWWETFNDNELNSLVSTALKNNRELKVAMENVNAASAVLKQSNSLQSIQADSTTSATRNIQSSSNDYNNLTLGLSASYELDIWGRLDALEQASEYDLNATQQELNSVAITLSSEVALAWYRLLEQHQQLQLLDRQIAINENYLQLLTAQFNISNVRAADIIQQRQSLAALHGEKEPTQALFKRYKTQLALLLGMDTSDAYLQALLSDVNLEKEYTTHFTSYRIDSTNLQERPDVKAAYFRLRANSNRLSASISNSYPRFSLGGTLYTSSEAIDELFKNWFATLAASLSAPLLDGGRRKAEVEQHRALERAALFSYEQTLLSALKEVQDAQSALVHQGRYVKSIEQQALLSLTSMRQIRQQYIYAKGDFLRLLTAQLNYENLQRTNLSAKRELIEKNIALHRAVASKITLPNTMETQ